MNADIIRVVDKVEFWELFEDKKEELCGKKILLQWTLVEKLKETARVDELMDNALILTWNYECKRLTSLEEKETIQRVMLLAREETKIGIFFCIKLKLLKSPSNFELSYQENGREFVYNSNLATCEVKQGVKEINKAKFFIMS